jgi:predicted O-methyltransferase YrrM
MQKTWDKVDEYIAQKLVGQDAALDASLEAIHAAGLPQIAVSPPQGKLLMLYARMIGARRVLEVGTLGGYSTIYLARGMEKGGTLITLEFDPKHAGIARANIAAAQLKVTVDVRTGAASDALPKIAAAKEGPFDLVFIDADKANNPLYFDWAVKLSRPGSVIVVDNVVRDGEVANPANDSAGVIGTRRMFDAIASDSRVTATAIQTVGSKGYDGFLIALVN